jgi:hypothetical protein
LLQQAGAVEVLVEDVLVVDEVDVDDVDDVEVVVVTVVEVVDEVELVLLEEDVLDVELVVVDEVELVDVVVVPWTGHAPGAGASFRLNRPGWFFTGVPPNSAQ